MIVSFFVSASFAHRSHGPTLPVVLVITIFFSLMTIGQPYACAADLEDILKAGRLRHLGIPYANFVTKDKSGLDVELMQAFSRYLGVKYEFVESNWQNIIPDLTGAVVKPCGEDVVIEGKAPAKGDVIATGFTILPWRKKIIDFSETTFPSGVWLIARSDAPIAPIAPTGNIETDIMAVKAGMKGTSVLTLKDSCLDPDLYHLKETGADIRLFPMDKGLDEMIPSVLAQMADATLMDVPVALVGLSTWPGKIKVIGPISENQEMAVAFSKSSPLLRKKFSDFFKKFKESGKYRAIVSKYYPSVFIYYPGFLH